MTSPSRRALLSAIGAAVAEAGCRAQRPTIDMLTPEQFGAKGDGATNDTAAFARLATEVMRRGGGTITLRQTTYIVGKQRPDMNREGFYLAPDPILNFTDLSNSLLINGNGAILRCAPGMRYGSFDPISHKKLTSEGVNLNRKTIASPYQAMISVVGSRGAVVIADIELDGNSSSLELGGPYGDVGRQIPATGIFLGDNRGDEILRRVKSHHHAQDGLMISGLVEPAPATRRTAQQVLCTDNGRQGCSLIGGRGWRFDNCSFNRSGRAAVTSPPAAGLDIEAEGGKTNRQHQFTDCTFIDNAGIGMVADTGDSADLSFVRCRFVGTSSAPVWPNKPHIRFDDCRFVGSVVDCHGDANAANAVHFVNCLFTDDPSLFPDKAIYHVDRPDGPLADLGNSQNVLFDHCRFLAVRKATLPWSTAAIYRNCTMRQVSPKTSYPRGRFEGDNMIDGAVDIANSPINGRLTINGRRIGRH